MKNKEIYRKQIFFLNTNKIGEEKEKKRKEEEEESESPVSIS